MCFSFKLLISVFVTVNFLFKEMYCSKKTPKIAVIGGGIGGTSAAYFLHELFGSHGAQIDLYESQRIGGRLASLRMGGRDYEVGGAVIHPRNKYMVDFVKTLGLKKRKMADSTVGLFDGKEFLFIESKWTVMNIIKLLWRYGFGPLKLHNYIDDMLSKFERIYEFQSKGIPFSTVPELLQAMSPQFVEKMKISVEKGFQRSGFSEQIIHELVSASLTANYGQDTSVHEFVGSVSVAGATPGLWAVHGGNSIVPEKLLEASKATLYKARVSRVMFVNESGEFVVESSPYRQNVGNELNKSEYDIVVIAAPLTTDTRKGMEFSQFPIEFSFPGNYHRTVCTLVHGKLNYSHFGFSSQESMVDEILTTNLGMVFSSIGRQLPVDNLSNKGRNKSEIWKIFSQFPLSKEVIDSVFLETEEVNIIDWLAYPHYEAAARTDHFRLFRHLYHVNAIEWAASAMEMSVIGAKNVALLAYNDWFNLDTGYREDSRNEL